MSTADPAPASCETPAMATPAAGAIERAEQRLAMFRRLAELGMKLTEKLTERALAAASDAEPRHDPADSFARVTRAVRLSLVLEAKADQDLAALRAGGAPAALAVDPDAWTPPDDPGGWKTRDHPSAHRNRIRDNVWDVINHETSITTSCRRMRSSTTCTSG
jgi:hypothetical protein